MSVLDKLIGDLGHKRRYREYVARRKALPEPYRTSAAALDRYLMHFGAVDDGETLVTMLDDLVTLLEQGAADGTPVRQLLGDDPVDFIETFLENYGRGSWIVKERDRLRRAVDEASAHEEER